MRADYAAAALTMRQCESELPQNNFLLVRRLQRRLQLFDGLFHAFGHNSVSIRVSLLCFLSDVLHVGKRRVERLLYNVRWIDRRFCWRRGELMCDGLKIRHSPTQDVELLTLNCLNAAKYDLIGFGQSFNVLTPSL